MPGNPITERRTLRSFCLATGGIPMIAASRRLNRCDFLLLGCSIALAIFMLWPRLPDRQWVRIDSGSGQYQRYSVAINDPRLQDLKERLAKWEVPPTTRALRVARWHRELADYYCQLEPATRLAEVAQVSFSSASETASATTSPQFWASLKQAATQRVMQEEQEIRHRQQNAVPPVLLGRTITNFRSPDAIPLAFLAAFVIVAMAAWRQRVHPPRVLCGRIDQPIANSENDPNSLPIGDSWVRIGQPFEVVIWRVIYATSVSVAGICMISASLA